MSSQALELVAHRPRPSRLWAGAALLVAAVVLAACGSGLPATSAPGPLVSQTDPVVYCLSTKPGSAVVVGSDLVQNTGSSTLVVNGVRLLEPSGLKLVASYLVPVFSGLMVGNGWSYPMTEVEQKELEQGVFWKDGSPAAGTKVPPSPSGREINVVVAVEPTGTAPGTAAGLGIDYDVGGSRYELHTSTQVSVHLAPDKCS